MVAERVVAAHELDVSRLHDRQHAVAERRNRRLGMRLRPIGVFVFGEEIARLREGRDPAPVGEPRVPADMVDMQMRAHDEIDVVDLEDRPRRAA